MYTRSSASDASMSKWLLLYYKSGDTLFKLSQQFGVSVDEIIRANPGIDPNSCK